MLLLLARSVKFVLLKDMADVCDAGFLVNFTEHYNPIVLVVKDCHVLIFIDCGLK